MDKQVYAILNGRIKSGGGGTYDDTAIKTDITNLQNGKADKSDVYTKTETNTALNNKVDKVENMGLSTNDFTTTYKKKLDSLANYDDTTLKSDIALNLSSIGMSKKNLLPFPQTITKGGIKFTCDTNGYMSASNTSSDIRQFDVSSSQYSVNLKAGKYILSFVSSTVCTNSFGNIMALTSDNTRIAIIGQSNYANKTSGSVEFTLDNEQTIYVMSKIFDGVTAVMIRYADITDDAYEPYTEDLQAQINNTIALNLSSIGMSRKNLLKNTASVVIKPSNSNVIFTTNSDKSVTMSSDGSCTSTTGIFFPTVYLDVGSYILSTGINDPILFQLYEENETTYISNHTVTNQYTLNITESKKYAIKLIALKGTTYNNVTVYPMLRYADITDDTYEPYQDDLQTQINNNNNDIALNLSSIGMTKKNLLKNAATSKSQNKVTYTVNSNGSVTVTNTETTPGNATLDINTNFKLNPGTYILTGDKEIRSVGEIRISVGGKVYSSYNTPFTITETSTVSYVRIYVFQDHNLGGTATVYPMLRYADITDDTYEPYQDDLQTQINNILARLTALEGGA